MGINELEPGTTRWWRLTIWPAIVAVVALFCALPLWAIPGLMFPPLKYGQSQAFQTIDLIVWHAVWLGGFSLTVALGAARYARTSGPQQPLRMRSLRDLAAAWPVGVLIFGILALAMDAAGLWRFTYLGVPEPRPQPPYYLDLRDLGRYPLGPLVGLIVGFMLAVLALRRFPSITSRLALGGSVLFVAALIQEHLIWPALGANARYANSALMTLQYSGRLPALLAGAYVVLWIWAARTRQAELAHRRSSKGTDALSTDKSILDLPSARLFSLIPAMVAGMIARAAILAWAYQPSGGSDYLWCLQDALVLWAVCVAAILGLTCRSREAWGRAAWGALLLAIAVGVAVCDMIWPPHHTGMIDGLVSIVSVAVIQIPALALGLGVGWVWRRCRRLCWRSEEIDSVELEIFDDDE